MLNYRRNGGFMARIPLASDEQCQIRNSQMAERGISKAEAYTQFMPNMSRLLSVRADIGVPFGELFSRLMADPARLTRLQREMIAVVTSQANRCQY
jgi:alkylhydroperoxidase family enzyme